MKKNLVADAITLANVRTATQLLCKNANSVENFHAHYEVWGDLATFIYDPLAIKFAERNKFFGAGKQRTYLEHFLNAGSKNVIRFCLSALVFEIQANCV